LLIIYDPKKRAPASKGDTLGFMSLGCAMENMWLMAESLGISLQILSVFGGEQVGRDVKKILKIPARMKIAYACRLGYPLSKPTKSLRVRRDAETLTHHNLYGNMGFD